MNADLVENIVQEVKSQGVFDEFRRDSMADVDTKPAYQNLRQRVEKTVKNFLSEQKWTPTMNKLQLREKLRKHVEDSGFLDIGIERIVDQVVNPKIETVFKTKIEDIAYKMFNIPKPPPSAPIAPPLPPYPVNPLHIDILHLLPTDLEQISPDSEVLSEKCEKDDKTDDFKAEANENQNDEARQDSPADEPTKQSNPCDVKDEIVNEDSITKQDINLAAEDNNSEKDTSFDMNYKNEIDKGDVELASKPFEKEVNHALAMGLQESHSLSQISSSSCLSMEVMEVDSQSHMQQVAAENISEEAQMPKFNENSSEGNAPEGRNNELHFDIKQDELKFEGTHRKLTASDFDLDCAEGNNSMDSNSEPKQKEVCENFNFSKISANVSEEPLANESSGSFSLNNSTTHQLCIVEKSETTQLSESDNKQALVNEKVKEATSLESGTSPAEDNSNSVVKKHAKESYHKEHKTNSHSSRSSSHHTKHKKSDKDRHHYKHKEHSRDKHSSSRHRTSDDHKHRSSSTSRTPSKKSSHSSSSHHKSHRHGSSGYKVHKETSLTESNTQKSEKSIFSGLNMHKRSETIEERHRSSRDKSTHKKSRHSSKHGKDHDDHYSLKQKKYTRASTDSNDEDKQPHHPGENSKGTNTDKVASKLLERKPSDSTGSKSETCSSSSPGEQTKSSISVADKRINIEAIVVKKSEEQKILAENAEPESIEMHLIDSSIATDTDNTAADLIQILQCGDETSENTAMENFLGFEPENEELLEKLILIEVAHAECKKALDDLAISIQADLAKNFKRKISADSADGSQKIREEFGPPRKILHLSESKSAMVSPTFSETSVNSKENECVPLKISESCSVAKKKCAPKRLTSLEKQKQQRYSSDDLYKPRPVLGQTSRRRGLLDTIDPGLQF